MGTRGFMAYRYKGKSLDINSTLYVLTVAVTVSGKYYRVYIPDYAHPSEYVRGCTASIPRDPTRLEGRGFDFSYTIKLIRITCVDWLEKVARALESKSQWNRLFGGDEVELLSGEEDKLDGGDQDEYDSEDQERGRLEIIPARDCSWTLGEAFLGYIYVIDLDNRVFSFNGAVHFRLDNMPPNRSTRSEWSLVRYLSSYEKVKIPDKCLKRVDLWPPPRFDITQAQQKYDQLQPLIAAPAKWGVPSWDILTVPQRLATSLVEALVEDYTDELALTQFSSVWHKVGLFCWQVANAAAPSHLTCPPLDATPKATSLYVRADLIKRPSSTDPSIHNHMGGRGTLGRYCWFRGCLITFCPRLDEPAYMMHQVNEMVDNMPKHGRTSEIGIVMSGWHVVAVAVDGFQVRQSPVLDLHDGKELKDGILLLMHLLSPIFTTAKAPWRKESLVNHPNVASTLPEDIIQQIIHFTDLDTYSILSLVSRYFRSIYLAYPRVGHYILLGYGATANTESKYRGAVFKVRNTDSTSSTLARLMRTASCIDNRLPLWSYRAKCYLRCILRPGLAGTFQHLQLGTGPLDHTSSENGGPPRGRVLFCDVIRGDKHPEMRIQALDGLWEMIRVGEEGKANAIQFTWQPYWGINISEYMTGFDREDIEELSEVEGGWVRW